MSIKTLLVQANIVLAASVIRQAGSYRTGDLETPSPSAGGVLIYNHCSFPIYSNTVNPPWAVSPKGPAEIGQKSWYWEPYYNVSSGGTSLKLRRFPALDGTVPITQVEYTIVQDEYWYDISNVNCGPTSVTTTDGCPFLENGMLLHSSSECRDLACRGGDVRCQQAYNLPNDDWATAGCAFENQNLVFYACNDLVDAVGGAAVSRQDNSCEP